MLEFRQFLSGKILLALIFLLPATSRAETLQLTQKAAAYDLQNQSKLLGYFEAQSSLEVDDFVESAGMYRVRYKLPNGTEMIALCKPADLGKTAPSKASAPIPPPPPQTAPSPSEPPKPASDPDASKSTPAPVGTPPLYTAMASFDPGIWGTTSSQFALKQSSFGFRWVSQTDTTTSRSAAPLSFLNLPVFETIAKFKEGKLNDAIILFFGRGDAKRDLDETEFQDFMKNIETALDKWTQVKGLDAWIAGNAADTKRKSWFKPPLRVDLEWSVSRNVTEGEYTSAVKKRFRTEFVRLAISPYDGKQDVSQLVKPNFQAAAPTSVKRAELKDRVKRDADGETYLDGVPMVDQGQKGYCVVASTERLMRYFGLDIDQNELAKAANTGTQGGTSSDNNLKALKKLGGQFSLSVRELISLDLNDFFKDVDSYNKLAKRAKKSELNVPTSGLIPVGEVYDHMDPILFREVRMKRSNEKTKFVSDISTAIDNGAPLLWSVMLGLVPETPALPQARGGHMRMIIGYNKKTNEIIYSDSWGSGHEFKKMSVDDAFFITHGLYSLLPGS